MGVCSWQWLKRGHLSRNSRDGAVGLLMFGTQRQPWHQRHHQLQQAALLRSVRAMLGLGAGQGKYALASLQKV